MTLVSFGPVNGLAPVRHQTTLQWRHNGRDSVSNHQPGECLLSCLIRRRSKKTSKVRDTGLCAGNSPGTGEFPAQMASDAEMFPFDDVIMITETNNVLLPVRRLETMLRTNFSVLKMFYFEHYERPPVRTLLTSWNENAFRITGPLWG